MPIVCKRCGSADFLEPDPAGYHRDAENEEGAPLLCSCCCNPATYAEMHRQVIKDIVLGLGVPSHLLGLGKHDKS